MDTRSYKRYIKSLSPKMEIARKNANFSQEDICKEIGISRRTYSAWLQGNIDPGIGRMIMFCRACNVPLSYFDVSDNVDDSSRRLARIEKNIADIAKFISDR